jgi:hypothetical protein
MQDLTTRKDIEYGWPETITRHNPTILRIHAIVQPFSVIDTPDVWDKRIQVLNGATLKESAYVEPFAHMNSEFIIITANKMSQRSWRIPDGSELWSMKSEEPSPFWVMIFFPEPIDSCDGFFCQPHELIIP